MRRHGKLAALLLCICFIAVSVCSLFLLATHAGHHCTEEHCAVCLWVDHTFQLLKQLRSGLRAALAGACLLLAALLLGRPLGPLFLRRQTPVTLKIQMNH